MAEGCGSGGGGRVETSGSRSATSYEAAGGRRRFAVELRPGETTIVSWKKLLKDATSSNNAFTTSSSSKPDNGPGPTQHAPSSDQLLPPPLSLSDRLAPVSENEAREGPPASRLGTVIERIERLYVGKASSEEEDINNDVPDDDEYDTQDSFIDDAELDEYFQVDNSAIKHEGFFVNRGKLERIEPPALPDQQPKKRRRKELAKDSDDVRLNPDKLLNGGEKTTKSEPLNGRRLLDPSHNAAMPSGQLKDVNFQNQISKKSVDTKSSLEMPPSIVSNGAAVLQEKDIDQQTIVVLLSNNHGYKSEEGTKISDTGMESLNDKSSYGQEKLSPGGSLNNIREPGSSIQQREKGGFHEKPESSVSKGKNPLQVAKVPAAQRKEGSTVRPKSSRLEKAIRDLEKLVSESRPPRMEFQDGDNNASQAVKRRLPPEVKQKLAKVARLAQASHGKITKELLNRLMSIVGHMIQLRSLKRNLKTMISMGLSVKQEKENRVQQIKKEVAEMVTTRIPFMKSKALEQLSGTSDDFQESNTGDKEAFRKKYSMDDDLEDIICDLYDLYVEGLEEDAGPQVRKLYAELAALWPSGFMDNHGIKRAICRAKDRRRSLQSRDKVQHKTKRKQALAPKMEETGRVEAQPLNVVDHGLNSANKFQQ